MDCPILVTGPTGNVGKEVIKVLLKNNVKIRAAAHDMGKTWQLFKETVEYVPFDFGNPLTYSDALKDIKKVFLIRPSNINDIRSFFFPFIDAMKLNNIEHIVFISLQGADYNPFTPHRIIEDYIHKTGITYTFLRPCAYMQNMNSVHQPSIKEKSELFIPAGTGKTSFIDIRDIAELTHIIFSTEDHKNNDYTITGNVALNYYEVAEILSKVLDRKIVYKNPSPQVFEKRMQEEGKPTEFIKIMKIIYFLTKLHLAGSITYELEKLLNRKPTSFEQYAEDYKEYWL
jgi:uncharacterized protein YbjT (DUF2867 family)